MKKLKRSYIREILDATNENTISFAGGLPCENLFPKEQLKEAAIKVFDNSNSLQYTKSKGIEGLRKQIASFYTNYLDFPTSNEEILITTGSQQAFDIISKTFVQKEIYVQNPTYLGALSAFNVLGLNVKGFDSKEILKEQIDENSTIYLMSDFSNPTSDSLSLEERVEYSKILEEKGSFLIEDGAYSFLDFNANFKKPISATYKNSFHLGSFSKIVAPGLRVGWIRAKKEFIDKILISKEAIDLHTPTLNQMIIEQYLKDNDIFKHINKISFEYKEKMDFMASCFEKYIPSFKFEKPKGGMFIYGAFKEDSFELASKALQKNIAFVPASEFYCDNRKSNEARFNFTNTSKGQIEEGIKGLSLIVST